MPFSFYHSQYQRKAAPSQKSVATMNEGHGGENEEENIYTGSPSPSPANYAYQLPEVGGPIQPGSGGVSPQPTWSQHAIDRYAYDVMYMQQIQHATYQNWQMPVPPPDSQYGYFGPCFGPPFPHPPAKNHVMYHPGQHTASNMGPHQYPNWYSGLSSAGSSGSLGSLGRVGARNKSSSGRKSRRGKEKAQSASSQEFKYDARMTLHQIKGRIVKVAKDQDGSRFIQQRLTLADNSEVQLVYDETMPAIEELWNDVYGNFIIQKLLEFGTAAMKESIGKRLHSDTISLSTRVYGCRVIQKAFDELSKCDVANLISTFKGNGNVLLCLHDHNGNHVIQKCITILFGMAKEAQERGEDELCSFFLCSLEPIIDEIIGSVEDLSRHPYGCRAVQRMVEHCIDPQKDRILDSIIACQRSLLEDQYGNYVVQNMLAHGRPSDRDAVFKSITANNSVIKFSKQKHASNVVEAMLRLGNADQRHQIVQEMLNCFCIDQDYKTESAVMSLSKNAYGNYVVKTALEVLEGGEQNDQLFSELLSNLGELEGVTFAKHIVAKVKAYQPNQKD